MSDERYAAKRAKRADEMVPKCGYGVCYCMSKYCPHAPQLQVLFTIYDPCTREVLGEKYIEDDQFVAFRNVLPVASLGGASSDPERIGVYRDEAEAILYRSGALTALEVIALCDELLPPEREYEYVTETDRWGTKKRIRRGWWQEWESVYGFEALCAWKWALAFIRQGAIVRRQWELNGVSIGARTDNPDPTCFQRDGEAEGGSEVPPGASGRPNLHGRRKRSRGRGQTPSGSLSASESDSFNLASQQPEIGDEELITDYVKRSVSPPPPPPIEWKWHVIN